MASRRDRTRGGNAALTGAGGAATRRSGGVSDLKAARARELHAFGIRAQLDDTIPESEAERRAADLRAERDRLIRQLRAEDEKRWSYGALAKAIGCSRELIAQVVKRR